MGKKGQDGTVNTDTLPLMTKGSGKSQWWGDCPTGSGIVRTLAPASTQSGTPTF